MSPSQAALAVERYDCPNCDVPAGSACRARDVKTAAKCHTPRFVLVPSMVTRQPEASTRRRQFLIPSVIDRCKTLANLKELRSGSAGATEVRLLFVFDPDRHAEILVGGDKAGNWSGWYRVAVPQAEQAYGGASEANRWRGRGAMTDHLKDPQAISWGDLAEDFAFTDHHTGLTSINTSDLRKRYR